ncbi:MAG: type II secretion system F family protein [Nanoarchaeota archaeon]|nr:type II secretion system F family protein [Nanoarchaeota archaeon]
MISNQNESFLELKKIISNERKIINEINSTQNDLERRGQDEKRMVFAQINSLKNILKEGNKNILQTLEKINLPKSLNLTKDESEKNPEEIKKVSENNKSIIKKVLKRLYSEKEFDSLDFERKSLKKLYAAKESKTSEKTGKKPSQYVKLANKIFANFSLSIIKGGKFKTLDKNLKKSSMNFLLRTYTSIILFTTALSMIIGLFIFIFFLFFNIVSSPPFITLVNEGIGARFVKIFWILFAAPIMTLSFMYFYPSLEKKSLEGRINQELPFATINMAAVSGSMIDPTKIFSIIISTKEYPALEKEFVKIINGINVLGYNLVTVLRLGASNSPSKKLSELLNGLATTISSGGELPKFFDERAKTLLFEYKLEREKSIRADETFMDIYISVVIAAPMILMLLLIIIQISGIGGSISISAITILMVLAVTTINILFLTFLHLRQGKESG